MKLNKDKCHFIVSNNTTEHLWAKVDDELIWESCEEKLLGVIIDKKSHRLGKNCEAFAVPQKKTCTNIFY